MSMCRVYLNRILRRLEPESPRSLLLYRHEVRSLIGEVLMEPKDLGSPGPYVPLFSQINLTNTSGRNSEVIIIIINNLKNCANFVEQKNAAASLPLVLYYDHRKPRSSQQRSQYFSRFGYQNSCRIREGRHRRCRKSERRSSSFGSGTCSCGSNTHSEASIAPGPFTESYYAW